MRRKSALTRLLRGLSELVAQEADRNPEFAAKLNELLESVPGKSSGRGRSRRGAKSQLDVPDVYHELELRGNEEFQFWLRDLPLPMLRVIIRKHDFDNARRTAKWKDTEKLGAYIAERLQGRLERGSHFMRGNASS